MSLDRGRAIKLPHELWDIVTKHLGVLSTDAAANVFKIPRSSAQQQHAKVWKAIFKDENWTSKARAQGLNPALVGHDLHNLYDCADIQSAKPTYIALVTGDMSGDLRHYKETLLTSLRPHTFINESTKEIAFAGTEITLNISDAIDNPEIVPIQPTKLFSRSGKLRSACLYWGDNKLVKIRKDNKLVKIGKNDYKLVTIRRKDIVGIGRKATTLENVSLVCGLTLRMHDANNQPQAFKDPECKEPISPIFQKRKLVGWKLSTRH